MIGRFAGYTGLVVSLVLLPFPPGIAAKQSASSPNPAMPDAQIVDFSGTWIQENPTNLAHPMRLKLEQSASMVTVWITYTETFSGPFADATVNQGEATWTQPQGCATRYRQSGYNYDNPGFNTFRLSLRGTTLVYRQEIHWLAPCDGHPVGVEEVTRELRRESQRPASPPQTPIPSGPSAEMSQPEANVITVWRVGDPWRGGIPDATVPPSLELAAKKLGYGLKVEAFPIQGFASVFFRAFERHQPPDILVFNNYGILEGTSTPLGSFTGIGTDPDIHAALLQVTESLKALEGRGWEYLIRTSPNHQAARALALRPPECSEDSAAAAFPAGLREFAEQSASAYLEGRPSIQDFEDPDRLHTAVTERKEHHVEAIKECGYWGSDSLAFVQATASFTSPATIGWVNTLMILRKPADHWRLLAASNDPDTNTSFIHQLHALVELITKQGTPVSAPEAPSLLAPQDGDFPVPAPGARFGDFSWHPSPSPGEVAEIAEFAYNDDDRLFAIFFSGSPPATEHFSAGMLWTTRSMWKWRVWSISANGAVSFSQARSFIN